MELASALRKRWDGSGHALGLPVDRRGAETMSDKRPSSAAERRECFEMNKQADITGRIYLVCHICKGHIWPSRGDRWEAEHAVPFANGGRETLPAHLDCHREKTRRDVSEIAKGKRVRDKHFGIVRKKGFYRPKGFKFDWGTKRYVREET
jgi:hypothetical protein